MLIDLGMLHGISDNGNNRVFGGSFWGGIKITIASTGPVCSGMETMGKKGLQEVAVQNAQKAAYAAKQIAAIAAFSVPFSAPSFNEFVVRGPRPATEVLAGLREKGIIGGLPLSKYYSGRENEFLVCVTEVSSREKIDALVTTLSNG